MTQYEQPTVQIVAADQLIEQLGANASTNISIINGIVGIVD